MRVRPPPLARMTEIDGRNVCDKCSGLHHTGDCPELGFVPPGTMSLFDTNGFNQIAKLVHQNSVNHGFYDPPPSFMDRMMLIVTEVAEAVEEYRTGHNPLELRIENGKPEGVPAEIADVIIRCLDFCAYVGIDIETAIRLKHNYNLTRPHKHGKIL